MSLYPSRIKPIPKGPSEFDVLKAHHKFLRRPDDEIGEGPSKLSWEDRLASKYEESLFREFALCDLKHYKSGNFSLRWRTEDEVVSGAGESSCANTRCEYHPPREDEEPTTSLTTLELPFAYAEHGENKSALVKVVLCKRCVKKLMYKRTKEKEAFLAAATAADDGTLLGTSASSNPPEDLSSRRHLQKHKDVRHHPYSRS